MKRIVEIAKGFVAALAVGFVSIFCWEMCECEAVVVQAHDQLPSIEDIQKAVGANPDGKLGKEFQSRWDAAICEQYAQKIQDRRI